MTSQFTESRTKTVTPTAIGTDQTFALFPVKAGDIIETCALRRLIPADAASDSTWQFALTTTGLVLGATIDTEGTALSLVQGSVSQYLVLVNSTIEIRYAQGSTDGATNPSVRVNCRISRNRGDL